MSHNPFVEYYHDDTVRPTWHHSYTTRKAESGRMICRFVISPEGVLSFDGCMNMYVLLGIMEWSLHFLIGAMSSSLINVDTIVDGKYKVIIVEVHPITWHGMLSVPVHNPQLDVSSLDGEPLEDARFHISNIHTFVI